MFVHSSFEALVGECFKHCKLRKLKFLEWFNETFLLVYDCYPWFMSSSFVEWSGLILEMEKLVVWSSLKTYLKELWAPCIFGEISKLNKNPWLSVALLLESLHLNMARLLFDPIFVNCDMVLCLSSSKEVSWVGFVSWANLFRPLPKAPELLGGLRVLP